MSILLKSELDLLLKLIEKLSVKKPSGQTKLKVLKDIAKEHQIAKFRLNKVMSVHLEG